MNTPMNTVSNKLSAAVLELPAAETTCMTLIVNGTNLGIAGINGNYIFDILPFLFIGTNTITIKSMRRTKKPLRTSS